MNNTRAEILQILKKEDSVNDGIFTGEVIDFLELKTEDYKARFTSFYLVQFTGLVLFDKVNLSIGISFTECSFIEPAIFQSIIASGYDPIINPNSESIAFRKCNFSERVFIGKDCNIERTILFEDC